MTEGTFSQLEIDATPEALYDVVADIESYPEWATGVKEAEVLENDAEGRVVRARFVLDGFAWVMIVAILALAVAIVMAALFAGGF